MADWTKAPVLARPGETPNWDAVEGVWIPRPWLAAETCPKVETQAGPAAPASAQTAGLAVIHEAAASRLGRRDGRAYSHTIKADGEESARPPTQGYRLLLEGRIVTFADGRPIRCHAAMPDQRPVCVVAVKLDKVAFEDGETGAVLSEWEPG